jgi:hypothetical protein
MTIRTARTTKNQNHRNFRLSRYTHPVSQKANRPLRKATIKKCTLRTSQVVMLPAGRGGVNAQSCQVVETERKCLTSKMDHVIARRTIYPTIAKRPVRKQSPPA